MQYESYLLMNIMHWIGFSVYTLLFNKLQPSTRMTFHGTGTRQTRGHGMAMWPILTEFNRS